MLPSDRINDHHYGVVLIREDRHGNSKRFYGVHPEKSRFLNPPRIEHSECFFKDWNRICNRCVFCKTQHNQGRNSTNAKEKPKQKRHKKILHQFVALRRQEVRERRIVHRTTSPGLSIATAGRPAHSDSVGMRFKKFVASIHRSVSLTVSHQRPRRTLVFPPECWLARRLVLVDGIAVAPVVEVKPNKHDAQECRVGPAHVRPE